MDYLTVSHLSLKEIRRIFQKICVNPETGCWEWLASKDKGGYGRVYLQGKPSQLVYRVMYAWAVEPVPKGRGKEIPNLDHIVCDNEGCCNPAHVVLSTVRNNTLRGNGPTAINARMTHCSRGHEFSFVPLRNGGTKRECIICRNNRMRQKRSDPAYREKMRVYLREYYRQRKGKAA